MLGLERMNVVSAVIAAGFLACIGSTGSWSAESNLSIELNRLSPVKDACRMSFVFTNGLDVSIDELSIETVLFNKSESVERFLVLKSRPLTPKKIRVQQFDVRGVSCDAFGKLLLNDVKGCSGGGMSAADCLARIKPSSRADVPFISTSVSN